ncbi:MAG TPA: isoprenoid biosynthesis protein ElbB [Planctomycetes bacterium]|nr:isoprenoid biosynthesis protein ElbB [Planctomycetota bacterium]|tara:strand:- start:211 stop:873 length:663 start_codon:yes stop_codon:yes gene_type:complete
MVRVGVCLSGCGVFDGAEIHESVLVLLALDEAGAEAVCFAPDCDQMHVVNHLTGDIAEGESRNVLQESARIARGEVVDAAQIGVDDFDALIFPGGFGAAKNLCDFAVTGADCSVHPDVERVVQGVVNAGKPLGVICIAPAMAAAALRDNPGSRLTIGNDSGTAEAMEALGAKHVDKTVGNIQVDRDRKIVSTPAYMLAESIADADKGIRKLVAKVLELID